MVKFAEGNTVSDYLPEEVKHKVSISTSVIPIEWQGVKVNILDTPGYSDFFGEVKSALRVVECGVLVLMRGGRIRSSGGNYMGCHGTTEVT